jgi:hypothetical protein
MKNKHQIHYGFVFWGLVLFGISYLFTREAQSIYDSSPNSPLVIWYFIAAGIAMFYSIWIFGEKTGINDRRNNYH